MAMGPNPLEIALMILLSGMGIPPGQEDPLASKIAPAECIFYMSWAATGTPDGTSDNSTEQLLAEPEVQEFLKKSGGSMFGALGNIPPGPNGQNPAAEFARISELIKGKAGAFYLSDLQLRGNDPPVVSGGGLLRLDDDVADVKEIIEGFQSQAPEGNVTEVKIGTRTFSRVVLDDDAPVLTWGVAGKYLLFGFGDNAIEGLMRRAGGQSPDWLTAAKAKLKVPRRSSVMYTDVNRIIGLVTEATAEDPEVGQVISALGLDKLGTFVTVNGMDDSGCVMRSELSINGQPTGILTLLDTPPLNSKDLALMGKDSPVALAFKLDGSKVLDLVLDIAGQFGEAEEIEQGLAILKQQMQIDVRADVLASLGDTWRVYAQPGPNGLITGWTVAVSVRNREKLERVQKTLTTILQGQLQQAGPGAPQLQTSEVGGYTVHTLSFGQPGVPAAPSWCITDDELFITVTPEQLRSHLSGGAQGESIAQNETVKSLFAADARTLGFAYVDTQEVAKGLMPMAQLGLQMAGGQRGMPPLDTDGLPSADSIIPHLRPSLFAVQRTAAGLELSSFQTLPGGNAGAGAPVMVALLLPAVQAAREAARRMEGSNNLKQIGLAMHNYHDTYRAFPAGYSADAEGKPLLSWRVHILPFIEEQALYERFHLDEPWDSPHNKELIPLMPQVYRCPNSRAEPGMTNYLGIAGADGVFVRPQAGDRLGASMRQITDGTANTIMTVEVPDETAVVWTKPADHAPNMQAPTKGLTGLRPGGFQVGFTDGSVRFIAETVDVNVLKALFTKSGGEAVPRF